MAQGRRNQSITAHDRTCALQPATTSTAKPEPPIWARIVFRPSTLYNRRESKVTGMSGGVGQRAFQNARLQKKHKAETAKLLERAIALVNTGALPDARVVLQQLLGLAPRHFDALYLLGMTEYHTRRYPEAEFFLAQAIDAEPKSADAHFNRGVVLTSLGRLEEARACYQRAATLKPQHANALYNLSYVCGALNRQEEALENYDKTLAIKKDFAEAWYNRGLVLEKLKRYQDAVDSHERALAIRPRFIEALNGRGSALNELKRSAEALESYDAALAINPNFAEALNNRGIALFEQGDNDAALENYDRAIAADPKLADAHNNRGNVLRALGRHGDALESYEKALAIDPLSWKALNGRGAALTFLRDFNGAIKSLARAIEIKPDYADAFANRGGTLLEMKMKPAAILNLDRAVELDPDLAIAWLLRGHALLASTRTAEAVACAEKALAIKPDSPSAFALMGLCLAALGDIDGAIAKFDEALAIQPDNGEAVVTKIFVMDFSAAATFENHRDVRKLWWEHIGSKIHTDDDAHPNTLDPQRRIVVGYLSSDFRNHSAASSFRPVLQYIDKAQFETVCYSCSPVRDAVTEGFEKLADRWHNAEQWDNGRLAQQIRDDGVDILVDLSGHTDGNRLPVIVRRPAPIQVHGWGHGTPPGLPDMDYVFSDPVTIPPEVRHLYTETIYDLPCMLTLEWLPADVPRTSLPALKNGFVTFGVFNRISKISDQAIEVWARIFDQVPGARLLIKDGALSDTFIRDNLISRLTKFGIAPDRTELRGPTPRPEHLAAYNDVDICLDPFPQNGGVSTWEALRMSIPVVAMLGNALPKRISAGILTAIGLSDWIAENTEDYVRIAVERAGRLDELAQLRESMPARLASSDAGNPEKYAAAVGKAYRAMWQAYCARESASIADGTA
jgi:predicted O-linked N-acetylglucosamine transferase (SPINDLY family)